jgi:hypothetical protein
MGEYSVGLNAIRGRCYVYRTSGYNTIGMVAWSPVGGAQQVKPIKTGETVSFDVNGQAGTFVNGSPAKLQLLWTNEAATEVVATNFHAVNKLLKQQGLGNAGLIDSTAQQAMDTLNAQWYNAVVTGCGLDPSTFQLIQGNTPLGSTSEILWNMFDAVPPLSISNFFNPSQGNVFSTDYGAVINNLKEQNANKFQNDMGDYYQQWRTYLKTSPTMPQGGILALFYNWAQMNLPPDQAQQCYTDYQQISQGAVPAAVQMWLNAGGSTGGTKAYNGTIAQLQSSLQAAPSKSFTFNSSTASSDISHSWAKAEAGFLFDIFEIGGDGSYDHLTETLTAAGISMDVKFQRLASFAAGPLSKVSSDPILSTYQPWYSSAALNLAYQNNNNLVWNNTPPTWDNTFGPNGNMLRTASAIVVVDGITISTTSNNSLSTQDQTTVQTAVESGIWPFFEASGSGGWHHEASFNSEGMMTVNSICPVGNPQILGVIVTPIGGVLLT